MVVTKNLACLKYIQVMLHKCYYFIISFLLKNRNFMVRLNLNFYEENNKVILIRITVSTYGTYGKKGFKYSIYRNRLQRANLE